MDPSPVPLDQKGLEIWRQRYEATRLEQWPRMQRLYHAEVHGPTKFSGPTIIILDRHERSTDPMLFYCLESYGAPAARADNTGFSRLADYLGGPIYDEKKAGIPQLSIARKILFLLQNECTILLSPYTDIHNGKLSPRVLELAFNFEMAGKVGEVSYVPVTVRYSGVHPLLGLAAQLRAFPSYWPIPYITKAEVFISNFPIKIAQLPGKNRSIDGLVNAVFEQAKTLPERFHSDQK